jgi:hypothetical protein
LVGSWLFCLQNLPCLVSLWCMRGGSVEVWTKNILYRFMEGQTHFGILSNSSKLYQEMWRWDVPRFVGWDRNSSKYDASILALDAKRIEFSTHFNPSKMESVYPIRPSLICSSFSEPSYDAIFCAWNALSHCLILPIFALTSRIVIAFIRNVLQAYNSQLLPYDLILHHLLWRHWCMWRPWRALFLL